MKVIGAFAGGVAVSIFVFVAGAVMYQVHRDTIDTANSALQAARSYATEARESVTKAQKLADEAGLKASYANTSAEECRSFADMTKKQIAEAVEVVHRNQALKGDVRAEVKPPMPKFGPNGGPLQ